MKQALPLIALLIVLLAGACNSSRDKGDPRKPPLIDARAEELMLQGKQALSASRYAEALDAFELARSREFNRSTTAATYFAGLAAYKLGYDEVAEERFATLRSTYPRSNYLEDATYHEALIRLRKQDPAARAEGFKGLLAVSAVTADESLEKEALAQARQAAFNRATVEELQNWLQNAPQNGRQIVVEALTYKLVLSARREQGQQIYKDYLATGGTDSPFLKTMFPAAPPAPVVPKQIEPEILRFAMFLPLFLDNPDLPYVTQIPDENELGLEFYEGFQLAMDEFALKSPKKVYLQLFDSRRDTSLVRQYLRRLDSVGVNMVVGDIYNNESRTLSAWAENRKIPQVIPVSATAELVDNKSFTFLAHPSARVHGANMARYAWNNLSLRRTFVFTDQQKASQELADGYMDEFLRLGGRVDTMVISPVYSQALKQIPKHVGNVPAENPEVGVYIPLMNNEEASGLIVNLLRAKSKDVTVMGSPHFRTRYTTLSRDIKDGYKMLFSSSHMHDENDPAYQALNAAYLRSYKMPLTENVIQGYDLGMYLLQLLSNYAPGGGTDIDNYLRNAPVYKGIHIDYRFSNTQGNQQVNIGQFLPGGVVRVNN
ncbi:MAG: hypothetical protein EAZ89_09460 [Bacteroidetes bacterium]|nr:MAG: hypothetical protein EAZ89_09460 [Bacteroidota bacterium]